MDEKIELDKYIKNWIDYLSIPRNELDNFSVCPYAKKSKYLIFETMLKNIDIDNIDNNIDVIIYKILDTVTEIELFDACKILNKKSSNLIFLPDHKDRNTFISNFQTNNGKFNLILCQNKKELQEARLKLMNTNYYKFWNEEYLTEILKT